MAEAAVTALTEEGAGMDGEDDEEPWSDTEIELPWEADNCSGSPESTICAD